MKVFEIIHHHSDYVKPTLVKHPLIVNNEMLGIEIELENVSGRLRSLYWVEKSDGSLRNNGREFVFRGPLGGVDLFKALSEAGKHFYEIKPSATWRCSTHVHMDVRDMEVKELKSLILLYTIFEEVLFKCSGYNRYRNNFGPAFGFAQQQIEVLSNIWHLSDSEFLDRVLGCWSKYSSLNLLPIGRFGSVEFRIANALTATGELIRLCNRFLMLKEWALRWGGSHEDLINYYSSVDVSHLFNAKLTGVNSEEIDQSLVTKGSFLANDILNLAQKRRELVAGSGMILTNLTPSRIASLKNFAARGDLENSARERDLHDWLCEVSESGAFREITVERARSLVDVLGVSNTWVAHSDFVHLLND